MPSLKPKELLKILLREGFIIDHTSGSHYILYRDDGKRVVVPYHAKDLPKGTLFAIIKSAGLEIEDLKK